MALQKKTKIGAIIIVAVLVIAGITVGSILGRTKNSISSAEASSSPAPSSAATPAPLIVLKTATQLNCQSTPYVVAEKKGFFAEQGLKIEYTGELNATAVLPAVLNGTNDFAGTLPNQLATFINQDAKIKAVTMSIVDPPADADPAYRHMRFYVNPKTGVKSWQDLVNYKKGQPLTISGRVPTCSSFIPNAIFDKQGLDRNRLQYVAFDTDTAAIQAAQQGNLDIVGVHPPFYNLAEKSGLTLIGDSADSGLGPAAGVSVYYFTDDFIQKHPDTVQKFVTAIKEAQAWANNNKDEAIKLTGEYINQDVTAVHYYYTQDGFPKDYIQPWLDDLVTAGTIPAGKLTVDDLITTQFQ